MKVGVHVETRGAKVIGSRHVRNQTLSTSPHLGQPHPHVPVPGLVRCWPPWLQFTSVQTPLQHPAQTLPPQYESMQELFALLFKYLCLRDAKMFELLVLMKNICGTDSPASSLLCRPGWGQPRCVRSPGHSTQRHSTVLDQSREH